MVPHMTTTAPHHTTRGMAQVAVRIGQPVPEYLRAAYLDRRLSMAAIAAELGVDKGTVSRWMAALGIEARYVGYAGRPSRGAAA